MEFKFSANFTYKMTFCQISWIFNVFDEDGGGTIDIEEVKKLVVSLLKLTNTPVVSDNCSRLSFSECLV